MRRRSREFGGSTLIEFTMVGIPMIFVLISTFEIARGMWLYQNVGFAVKAGSRYASVHGAGCDPTSSPNNCQVTIQNIAAVIQSAGPGLLADQLTLTCKGTRPTAATVFSLTASCCDDWASPDAGHHCSTDLLKPEESNGYRIVYRLL
jgi:Flp pilus assembly protein TadG